jgi:PadR family transcriptional regulator, regulatory protein PadR
MGEFLDPNWEAQIRKGWMEVAILATLWSGRKYGLEIIRALEERPALIIAEGTIYPVLTRLHRDGLVDAEWEESDSGHPRKYYSLTAYGRRRALKLARQSSEFLGKMLTLVQPLVKEEK